MRDVTANKSDLPRHLLALLGLFCATVAPAQQPATNAQPTELRVLWSKDIGSFTDSSPAIAEDGTVYFGTFDGRLWALTSDGKTKWIFRAGREIKSSPALGKDGTIYFGSRDRSFYAVNSEGRKKWSLKTAAWVDSSPAIGSDGTIFFGGWDKTFYAVRPDGAKAWAFKAGGEIVSSAAIGADGTIYFGAHDAKLYALKPDGQKQWEFGTGDAIVSSPALNAEGTIYFSSVDGFLYALNPDGKLKWKTHTGGITESSPVLAENGNIIIGVNKWIHMISPEGKKIWEYGGHDYIEGCATALADGSFFFGSRNGRLDCMTQDRKLVWYCTLYAQGYNSPAIDKDGRIYLATYIQHQDFSALAHYQTLAGSPWPKFRGNRRNTGNLADQVRP